VLQNALFRNVAAAAATGGVYWHLGLKGLNI